MVFASAFNPTTGPVVVSERGHSIGGQEWGTISTTDEVAKSALESGQLLRAEQELDEVDKDTASNEALAALERTAAFVERSERVSALTKPKALVVARDAGLLGVDDEDPNRDELDQMLVEAVDVEIPAPSAVKKSTTSTESTSAAAGDEK